MVVLWWWGGAGASHLGNIRTVTSVSFPSFVIIVIQIITTKRLSGGPSCGAVPLGW